MEEQVIELATHNYPDLVQGNVGRLLEGWARKIDGDDEPGVEQTAACHLEERVCHKHAHRN